MKYFTRLYPRGKLLMQMASTSFQYLRTVHLKEGEHFVVRLSPRKIANLMLNIQVLRKVVDKLCDLLHVLDVEQLNTGQKSCSKNTYKSLDKMSRDYFRHVYADQAHQMEFILDSLAVAGSDAVHCNPDETLRLFSKIADNLMTNLTRESKEGKE